MYVCMYVCTYVVASIDHLVRVSLVNPMRFEAPKHSDNRNKTVF